ncbi:MAG: hypothetical protein D6820_11635, partial [Lentisphaerae bacterium]
KANQPVLLLTLKTTEAANPSAIHVPSDLTHTNILLPQEIFLKDTTLFVVMEYYEGETLRKWLDNPRSISELRSVAMQIAEAVHQCHQYDVFLGCLPPEWIQITKDKIVKIYPWVALTRIPIPELQAYMAPEYRERKVITAASDTFAFGVLLHEMLVGRPPEFPFQSSGLSGIPEPLRQSLERCLESDPARRLDNMQAVIEHIAMSDVYSGAVIEDRYEIERELGRGGMGRVFLAHDRVLGEKVAIKLLNTEVITQHNAAQRLVQEIKIARKITHPNVVKVYEIRLSRGKHYITMEFVNGVPLHKVVKNTGPFPLKIWWKMARQIIAGLSSAHALGIVHRDLKPQNILMTREGMIKILDFANARAVDVSGDQTQTGAIFGSPKY